DQRVFVADIKKITNAIDWSPKVSAKDGVQKMYDWTSSI
ncbi:CDP-paratose 2-epimerase, partial [Salmonella enterica]